MSYLKVRDGIELCYKKDLSDKPKAVVLINHGFAEHLGRYDYTAQYFANKGFHVYRYDLRGHGNTTSEPGAIESFNQFIDDCDEMVELIRRENSNLPIIMLGHSMGGLITALYGIKHKNKLIGQIFSGSALGELPSIKGKKYLLLIANTLFRNMKLKNPIDDALCSNREVFTSYINDPLVLKKATINFFVEAFVKSIEGFDEKVKEYDYPCLITHGEEDRVVPRMLSRNFYENIASTDKEIKIYKGLYHEILNEKERDTILEDMTDWLNRRIESNKK